jgi:hypothetical protein
VFCKFGGMLVEPTRIDVFKCTRDLLMESDPAKGDNLVVQRLPKKCVAKAIRSRRADSGVFLDDGGRRGLLQGSLELLFRTDRVKRPATVTAWQCKVTCDCPRRSSSINLPAVVGRVS